MLKLFLQLWFMRLLIFYSWGPEDDGKTVDGPHYLSNVRFFFFRVLCSRIHFHITFTRMCMPYEKVCTWTLDLSPRSLVLSASLPLIKHYHFFSFIY